VEIKKLTKYLVLKTAKWLFISGPSNLAHAKKKEKTPKKTLQIRLFLCTPKCIFISGPSDLAHAKIIEKRPKNHKQLLSETTKCPNFCISKKILKSTKKAPINSEEVSNMKIYKKIQRHVLWEQRF
jgi:hypothetical protein